MNEEKKLTDEEIAKAILQQIEYNAGIPYIDEWLKVKTIKFTDILNFIHRLQSENKELRTESDRMVAEHLAFTELAKKADEQQKAEIERLTEEIKSIKELTTEQVVESENLKQSCAEAVNSFIRLETLYKIKCKELELVNKKLEELKGGKID